MKKIIKNTINFLLPQYCVLCQQKTNRDLSICWACEKDLPFAGHVCRNCAKPLLTQDQVCGKCLKKPPPYHDLFTLFRYEQPIIAMITRLKFNNQLVYAKLLGELMANYLKDIKNPDFIIPVPLHNKRLQSRGFNQSVEIARPISKKLQIPIPKKCPSCRLLCL